MRDCLKLLCLLFFVFNGLLSNADSDSLFIKKFKNELIVSTFVSYKLSSLDYTSSDEVSRVLPHTYYPNSSTGFGLGLAWNWLSIGATIYNFKPEERYGKTSSFDFQTHWFFSKIQLSISLQDYKGFYTKDETFDDIIILRPDLRIKQYYAFGQYLFNHKKFSYMSAFSYDQQQLRSAGSLKVGLGAYYSMVSADSTLIINSTEEGREFYEDFQIGPNVGYAHNFIFFKRYFFTASLTAGVGFSVKNNDNKLKVFPAFFPRFALGYNGNNWTIGVSAQVSRSSFARLKEVDMSINSGIFQFTFAYRFPFDIKKMLFK